MLSVSIVSCSQANAMVPYGEKLCNQPGFSCINVKSGQTWHRLFPDAGARDLLQRINRTNLRLRAGMQLAVPQALDRLTVYDIAPLPHYIESNGEKIIYVNQEKLAWAAYDEAGEMVWWGPISAGSPHCSAVGGQCKTPTGVYRIIRKQGFECISTAFPRRSNGQHGGAKMPFCMHFFQGYALHGSTEVPGYPDSHGCVRMFVKDAQWLNEAFVDIPGGGMQGTRVIIE
ncbi:MAG: L,D-transpeptidase [Legionella sp.]|nr:L,D-transpeptidase [Legionella sp.]